MKLRHAAALALVGWYLMFPPFTQGWSARGASLKLWQIQDTFDSKADCESALSEYKADPARHLPFFRGRNPNEVRYEIAKDPNFWNPIIAAIQCVASDDPRLKPK